MHDIGKISIPESVIDKATKLQFMIDGIELVKERAEILKRDYEISFLKNEITKSEYQTKIQILEDDVNFIEKINFTIFITVNGLFFRKWHCDIKFSHIWSINQTANAHI